MNVSSGSIPYDYALLLPKEDLANSGLSEEVLAALGDAEGPGLGDVTVEAEFGATIVAPELFYGVTDWLTIGGVIPIFQEAHVNIRGLEFRSEFWAYNKDFVKDRSKTPIVPITDTRAVTGAEAIQGALVDGLEYQPIGNWKSHGVGDAIIVGQARLWHSNDVMFGLRSILVVPTGKEDNPNNLVDFGLGDGQFDIGATLLCNWQASVNLRLDLSGGYLAQLPSKREIRVYKSDGLQLGSKSQFPEPFSEYIGASQVMSHDLGDILHVKPGFALRVNRLLTLSGQYELKKKMQDKYNGEASVMSKATSFTTHGVSAGLELSLIESFLTGGFPVPLTAELQFTQAFSTEKKEKRRTILVSIGMFFGNSKGL